MSGRTPRTKSERIEHAIKAMLSIPRTENEKPSEKEWRSQCPTEKGWFLPRDLVREKVCRPIETSILRRDLKKEGLVDVKPLRRTDKKSREFKIHAIRLKRDINGALHVLKFICDSPTIYDQFITADTDYSNAIRIPIGDAFSRNKNQIGHLPESIDSRIITKAIISLFQESPTLLKSKKLLDQKSILGKVVELLCESLGKEDIALVRKYSRENIESFEGAISTLAYIQSLHDKQKQAGSPRSLESLQKKLRNLLTERDRLTKQLKEVRTKALTR